MLNPGGSVKDRPALAMITQAEREGLLRPGGTIVEPTSGNTGVGLAIVAAERGYRCIFVVTDKVAPEKIRLLEAYGAEVIVCPVAVEPDDPQSYYSVSERLVRRPGPSGPTSTTTAGTPGPTSRPPGPRSGGRRRAHHPLRGRGRHRRHHHRRGPLPQGAGTRRAGRRRPRRLGLLGRLGAALPGRGHRRGLLAHHLRPGPGRPGGAGQRRGQLHGPAGHLRGGPAHRGSGGTAVAAALEVGRESGPTTWWWC